MHADGSNPDEAHVQLVAAVPMSDDGCEPEAEVQARIDAWLPLLREDQDWDISYLVRIMQFKMRRMANCIEKNQIIMDADRVACELRITAAYFDRYLDSHKYGPPYPLDRDPIEWEPQRGRSGTRALKHLEPRERARVKRWAKQHESIERDSWNAAIEMIRKHGRGWWD